VEPLRRSSKVKLSRHRHEVAEVAQFDAITHIENIIIESNKILDV
jgi:hypothetical protein